MLPKHSRLTKQVIKETLSKARRIKTSRFLVMYATLPNNTQPQISVTVSKKVAPKAVLRNKLRRRGYAALTPLVKNLAPKSVILVSYLTADSKISIPLLTEELGGIFQKAGIVVVKSAS